MFSRDAKTGGRDAHPTRELARFIPAKLDVMKNIIVVGYPKSGCTWATRLTAELVGCPVAGFWGSDKKEIAVEGQERASEFRCYKSHHQLAELDLLPVGRDGVSPYQSSVIYILRDPRDIAISAANYFQFDRAPALVRLFRMLPQGEKLYRHTLYPLVASEAYRLERMADAVLQGRAAVHNWVRVPWHEHWRPYAEAGVPIMRYEDLLATPEREAARILQALGIDRSPAESATAIAHQSFDRKKAALLESGETGRAKFLRVGQSEQWREKLPAHLQKRFAQQLGAELAEWGYPVK